MKASSISWIAVVLMLGPTLCYPQQAQPAGAGNRRRRRRRATRARRSSTCRAESPRRHGGVGTLSPMGHRLRRCEHDPGDRAERRASHHPQRRAGAEAGVDVTGACGSAAGQHAARGRTGRQRPAHFVAVHPTSRRTGSSTLVSEDRREGLDAGGRARVPQGRRARRRAGDFRRRRVGDGRQPRRPRLLRQGQEPLRHDRRSRSHLLQRAATPSGRIG